MGSMGLNLLNWAAQRTAAGLAKGAFELGAAQGGPWAQGRHNVWVLPRAAQFREGIPNRSDNNDQENAEVL